MGLFDAQIKFITELEKELFSELEKTIQEYDFVLKDYIINKQLFREGIDGDGNKLLGYRRTTIRIKIAKGDPVDRTTLRNEGDFYRHIEITATPYYFVVSSNVPYDDKLINKYGKGILKVSHENMREFFNNYFIPNLREYAAKQIS